MDIHFFTDKQKREILLDKELQKSLNLDEEFIDDLRAYFYSEVYLPQIENLVALNNAQIVFKAISDLDEAMNLFYSGDSMQDLSKCLEEVEEDLYLAIGKFQKKILCKR